MASMDIQALLKTRAEAYTRRDAAALAVTYGEEAVVMSPMFPRTQGRAAIERSYESLFRIFPDWEITFEEPCITGTRAMQTCKVRATHRGDFMGIPGTGRRIEFESVLILDLEDGLVQYERRIYDFTGMLIQIGVLRGKPAV
jgi:C-1 hydroxylase